LSNKKMGLTINSDPRKSSSLTWKPNSSVKAESPAEVKASDHDDRTESQTPTLPRGARESASFSAPVSKGVATMAAKKTTAKKSTKAAAGKKTAKKAK
jgi:hypothetical protein